jgi:membrane protein
VRVATKAVTRRSADSTIVERLRSFLEVWLELFNKHELLTYASSIARTTIVAGVSLVLLILGVAGELGRKDLWTKQLAPHLKGRVLPDVYAGINQTVDHILAANSPGLIVFAALLSVWEVSGSVRGVTGALNRVYESRETRPWKLRFPISLALATVIIVALVSAILLVMALGGAVHGVAAVPFAIGRWLLAVLLITTAFGLLVRFAPAKPRAKKWVSVGASLVVVGWIIESLAFKWYVTSIADFKTAVGSLTVVLLVVGYLYVASVILLVGIELDELLRDKGEHVERTLLGFFRGLFRAWTRSARVRP